MEEILKLTQERDEYLDLAKRTKADFENYQKRNAKEREETRKYYQSAFALDILPILDNLQRVVNNKTQSTEFLLEGVLMISNQLQEALKKNGVVPIKNEGIFDPNVHQAIMQKPAQTEENVILEVLERGFMHHDRVLRPTKVIVSSGFIDKCKDI